MEDYDCEDRDGTFDHSGGKSNQVHRSLEHRLKRLPCLSFEFFFQILTRISLGDSEPYCTNQEPVEISELCSGAITYDTQFINPELGWRNEIALDFKARLSCFI